VIRGRILFEIPGLTKKPGLSAGLDSSPSPAGQLVQWLSRDDRTKDLADQIRDAIKRLREKADKVEEQRAAGIEPSSELLLETVSLSQGDSEATKKLLNATREVLDHWMGPRSELRALFVALERPPPITK
jgi:hypothetical protein